MQTQHIQNKRGIMAVFANSDAQAAQLVREIHGNFQKFKDSQEERVEGLADRLVELEQKTVGGMSPMQAGAGQSLAGKLFASSGFAEFREKRTKSVGFPVTATDLLKIQANTITQSGREIAPYDRPAGIVAGPQRKQWLRERLNVVPIAGGGVEYSRELAFTNNAAAQYDASPEAFEGVTKPESALTFELVTARVPTIAHWVKTSRQALDDQPALQAFLDMRLRYGLELKLESQIISGSGTGGEMTGLATAATAFTPATGDSGLDSVSKALALLENAGFTPDCVVLNPVDFGALQRAKTTTNEFILGDPAAATAPVLWGVPVFKSASVASGKFLAADLASSAALFIRQDASVLMSDSDGTNFVQNLVTVLAELRAVLGVLVPAGVYYGDLTL